MISAPGYKARNLVDLVQRPRDHTHSTQSSTYHDTRRSSGDKSRIGGNAHRDDGLTRVQQKGCSRIAFLRRGEHSGVLGAVCDDT